MAVADPGWCLPPIFDNGQRLHSLRGPTVFWLLPLLRQHQLCHAVAEHPDDLRAILLGDSSVFGHPLPIEETLSGRLNKRLVTDGVPARVFNLAFVNPYQLRDAVILNAALEYRPDLIIYPLSRNEFIHEAPVGLFGSNAAFFNSNDIAVRRLARTGMPGLEEPLERYEEAFARQGYATGATARLRDIGGLIRAAARAHAEALARWLDPAARTRLQRPRASTSYDCDKTAATEAERYADWQSWNILAYLQWIRDTYRIPVLVVSWPMTHEPVDDCYNAGFTNAGAAEFNQWLRAECAARGLHYIDLHALLTPAQFVDAIHATAEGHRLITERLAPTVEALLRERAATSRSDTVSAQ
jgi:hypothetical protein